MPDSSATNRNSDSAKLPAWLSRLFFWVSVRRLLFGVTVCGIGFGIVQFWEKQPDQHNEAAQLDEFDLSEFEAIQAHTPLKTESNPLIKAATTQTSAPETAAGGLLSTNTQTEPIRTIHFENVTTGQSAAPTVVQGAYLVGEIIPSSENQ